MIYPAMAKWIVANWGCDPETLAPVLHKFLQENPSSDNTIWSYLKATGMEEYSPEAFIKAAEILIREAQGEEIPDPFEESRNGTH